VFILVTQALTLSSFST